MVKISNIPFSDRLNAAHPSIADRDLGEVLRSTMNKKLNPLRILDRYRAEKGQVELNEALKLSLGNFVTDSSVSVVQVGAHNGMCDDPLYESLNENHWRAVLVEPTKQAFSSLDGLRGKRPNTTLVNKAVTPTGAPVTLFVPTIESFGEFGSVWTSTDKVQVEREIKRNIGTYVLRKNTHIDEIEIEGISPASLMEESGLSPGQVNILVVDVEGQDPPIVHAFLDAGALPEVLLYEHFHADRRHANNVNGRLLDEGYKLVHSVKDTLAVL